MKDVIIGCEIHIELNTNSKLFCGCPTQGNEKPNSRVCEICLGHPGSKPVANKKAIESTIKLAIALNCKLAKDVIFSRKSYFYPDMSKNYQITQYEIPVGQKGNSNNVRIKRVHLEEDPASLVHPGGIGKAKYVLVDYNRSGNPLSEIVTEPDLNSPEEARDFLKSLITILRYLKIFNPEQNIIKADANISIKESGFVKIEIKNITGFKEIERALNYEIERQRQLIEDNKKITQETRSWNVQKGITELLRTKETEEDYGYIFDPDLVPIEISDSWINKLLKEIPELPAAKAKRYVKKFKLSEDDALVITSEFALTEIFEKALKIDPNLAAKWIRRELVRVLNYNKIDVSDMKINENEFISLLDLLDKKKITDKVAQDILNKLVVEDIDVKKFVKEKKLDVLSDTSLLKKYCKEAIKENPKAVEDYKSGREEALNYILGSVMRKSKGKAEAQEIKKLLIKML